MSDKNRCQYCGSEPFGHFSICPLYDGFRHGLSQPDPRDATIAALRAEVEGLQQEMRALYRAYVGTLENGRDRIIFLGGECDSLERMEEGDPALIRARAALAEKEPT